MQRRWGSPAALGLQITARVRQPPLRSTRAVRDPSTADTQACCNTLTHDFVRDALAVVRLELWRDGHHTRVRTLLVCPSAVDTGMFEGIFASTLIAIKFAKWFIPLLPEHAVASRIHAAMLQGEQLVISCATGWRGMLLSWVPIIARFLPVSLYDLLVSLGGGLHGMDTFVGRRSATSHGQ